MNINCSSFQGITLFENKVAEWFNAPYGVAVDCCTHGLELALRYTEANEIKVPKHTYLSVPMLASKLNIKRTFVSNKWVDYYYITDNIVDSAVYWKKNSYIKGTYMVLSFQFKKHLSLSRGGMILTDSKDAYARLKSMAYDGRDQNSSKSWVDQDIHSIGYHYYMTPETAELGLSKLPKAIATKPRGWSSLDYPNLTNLKVFKNG